MNKNVMTKKEIEAQTKRFEKCCGRKPEVAILPAQFDAKGTCFNPVQTVLVWCKKCKANLSVQIIDESKEALMAVIDKAVEEWNVGKRVVIPFRIEGNFKKCRMESK